MNDRPMPHDLIWGMHQSALPPDAPCWATQALYAGDPVVVRRQAGPSDRIAVGIRGRSRAERYAAWMPLADIRRCVRPEGLILLRASTTHPALQTLQAIKPLLDTRGFCWGVTGSVGFALATGYNAMNPESDLDLLIRMPKLLPREAAKSLVAQLEERACCRFDIQLETPAGGLSLREWANGIRKVMIKTEYGPCLLADPWQQTELAA